MITVGFYCDKCGAGYEGNYTHKGWFPTKGSLVRIVRERGYTVGEQILCPKCKRGGKKSD